jgi:hypothetical protein
LREYETGSENFEQRLNIFTAGDTAEEHNLGISRQRPSERTRIPTQGIPVSRIARVDRNLRHLHKLLDCDYGLGRQKTTRCRHDEDRGKARWRHREGSGIGKLAAKIKAADKAEKLAERSALSSYAPCELEFGVPVQQLLSANRRSIGGREQKYA